MHKTEMVAVSAACNSREDVCQSFQAATFPYSKGGGERLTHTEGV